MNQATKAFAAVALDFAALCACGAGVSGPVKEDGRQLAFPGAEGWGRFARGARASASPSVYHVKNLDDEGPGSLRDAVSKPGRIVVFDVAGVIRLKSRVSFAHSLYIAGQTAPGDGVVVYGDGCSFSGANDIICRHLRWRMGRAGSKGKDCAGVSRGTNMIFDHCSFSWGRDETFSINSDGKGALGDITLQNCIFAQGLMTHSAGGLIQADRISLLRNLYVDNSTRNNKVKGVNQYCNNIVYNWKNGCYIMGGGSSGQSRCNIEGNLFIRGPAGGGGAFSRGNANFKYFALDNWLDADMDGRLNPRCIDMMDAGGEKVGERFDYPAVTHLSGRELLKKVLPTVGASLPSRDPCDKYVVAEVESLGKKGALIENEAELPIGAPTGWNLDKGRASADTDGDGMPDEWEKRNGTDRNRPDAVVRSRNGYLNIENYINSIKAK